jgi:uncharacterized integral membrane protein
MAKFFIPLIVAFWISAIALISVQNATPVSFQFLGFQSVQIPLGLVIAFSAALGMVGMTFGLPLWQITRSSQRSREDFEA